MCLTKPPGTKLVSPEQPFEFLAQCLMKNGINLVCKMTAYETYVNSYLKCFA